MDKEPKDKLTFEEALGQLEKIVAAVEQGKVGLEESLDKYEQGMRLIQHCRAILEQAEKRIETINRQGQPASGPGSDGAEEAAS